MILVCGHANNVFACICVGTTLFPVEKLVLSPLQLNFNILELKSVLICILSITALLHSLPSIYVYNLYSIKLIHFQLSEYTTQFFNMCIELCNHQQNLIFITLKRRCTFDLHRCTYSKQFI